MLGTFGDIASLSVATEGIRHCFASEFLSQSVIMEIKTADS